MKIENRDQATTVAAAQSTTTDDYVLDDQIGFILRCAHQRASAIFQEHFSSYQLTPPQFGALIKIRNFSSVSQNSLARATAMDIATMQGVVCRLVDRGLVDRNPDPNDKRRLVLTLSSKGNALVEASIDNGRAVTQKILAPLEEAERELFLDLIKRLI